MRKPSIAMCTLVAAVMLALPALATEPQSDWTTTQTLWDSGSFDYDGAGHVISIGTDIYRYDKAGRLKFATAATPSSAANQQEFDYDRYGNLTSLQVTTANATTLHGFAVDPATNQLGLDCSETVDGCFTGFYDPATGNQLGRHSANEYVWDSLGMLAELRTSRRERYIYDANDERILVVDDVTHNERYTLRNGANKVVRELSHRPANNTWTLDKDYVHRATAVVASFTGDQTAPDRHYHVDQLGSTRLVTDASGYRLAVHTYWPFGAEAAGSETDSGRLKFTGHERDSSPATTPGSDLDYMHARYYDANAGRFLSVDPSWGGTDFSEPQTWNRYTYVNNNPLRFTDPDGKVTVAIEVVVIGVVAVSAAVIGEEYLQSANEDDPSRTNAQVMASQISAGLDALQGGLVSFAEHVKGKRPSTRTKHERGQGRRVKDKGGERGDARRRPPRKRPPGHKGPWPPKIVPVPVPDTHPAPPPPAPTPPQPPKPQPPEPEPPPPHKEKERDWKSMFPWRF